MQRRNSYLLLAVMGVGVFLAGLELMVTAVALVQILATIASWTDLREASWIINGYLLVYVITMPLAGRLTDTWGARRLFLVALAVLTVRERRAYPEGSEITGTWHPAAFRGPESSRQ